MSEPIVARTRVALGAAVHRRSARSAEHRVVLVPTMGALHAGHAALLHRARERAGSRGSVVVSVFVNPLQFGPGEDLTRYPRTLAADLELCARHQVDVVFAPSVAEVYPGSAAADDDAAAATAGTVAPPEVRLDPGPLGARLEGAARPGHFAGVLSVVAKLFGLIGPDVAVFGEKDYQQLVLVRRMVADLCLPLEVVGVETVREPDGLALSSRNRLLSGPQRHAAAALARALRAGAAAGPDGAEAVRLAAHGVLAPVPPGVPPDVPPGVRPGVRPGVPPGAEAEVVLDYLELTGPDLGPVPETGPARLLVAAEVGSTRLIDNTAVHLGPDR